MPPIASALITGGSGLLAVNCAVWLRDRCRLTLAMHRRRISVSGVATVDCPLESVDGIRRVLDAVQPAVVIHAAGLTSVEACEAEPRLAGHVNVDLTANVARACAAGGHQLIHMSTDQLFAGDWPMAGEEQPVEPLNTYARTKAEAEARVFDANPDALVIRANFFGWGPSYRRSLSDRIIDPLRQGQRVTLFTDVFYTPILATALTDAVFDLASLGARGVMHVAGDDRLSKHEFGMKLANVFGLDAGLIEAGTLAERRELTRRPYDMSLSNARARAVIGRPLGSIDEQLKWLKQQEQTGIAGELCRI